MVDRLKWSWLVLVLALFALPLAQAGGTLTQCADLSYNGADEGANSVYNVTANIYNGTIGANGNCFNIISDNVTLDCGGYQVIYNATSGNNYAVYAEGTKNTTVRGCYFQHTSGAANARGIVLAGSTSNATIRNNTVYTFDTNGHGVWITDQAQWNLIEYNRFNTTGGGASGIRDQSFGHNTYRYNVVNVTGNTNGGVRASTSAKDLLSYGNTYNASGTNSHSLYLTSDNQLTSWGDVFYSKAAEINITGSSSIYIENSTFNLCNAGCKTSYAQLFITDDSNATLTNVSGFNTGNWTFGSGTNNATILNYLRVNATNQSGLPVVATVLQSTPLITVRNSTTPIGSSMLSEFAASTGLTSWQSYLYWQGNATTSVNYSEHNITADFMGWTANANTTLSTSKTIQLTLNQHAGANWTRLDNPSSNFSGATVNFTSQWAQSNACFIMLWVDNGTGTLVSVRNATNYCDSNPQEVSMGPVVFNSTSGSVIRWQFFMNQTGRGFNYTPIQSITTLGAISTRVLDERTLQPIYFNLTSTNDTTTTNVCLLCLTSANASSIYTQGSSYLSFINASYFTRTQYYTITSDFNLNQTVYLVSQSDAFAVAQVIRVINGNNQGLGGANITVYKTIGGQQTLLFTTFTPTGANSDGTVTTYLLQGDAYSVSACYQGDCVTAGFTGSASPLTLVIGASSVPTANQTGVLANTTVSIAPYNHLILSNTNVTVYINNTVNQLQWWAIRVLWNSTQIHFTNVTTLPGGGTIGYLVNLTNTTGGNFTVIALFKLSTSNDTYNFTAVYYNWNNSRIANVSAVSLANILPNIKATLCPNGQNCFGLGLAAMIVSAVMMSSVSSFLGVGVGGFLVLTILGGLWVFGFLPAGIFAAMMITAIAIFIWRMTT